MRLPIERGEDPGEESFFAFRGGAITSLTTPQPWVEQIPHGIAEHVETVNENLQAKTRPESQPWGHLHVLKPFPAEHTTPAENLDGQSESEETQRGLGNDDATNVD